MKRGSQFKLDVTSGNLKKLHDSVTSQALFSNLQGNRENKKGPKTSEIDQLSKNCGRLRPNVMI